MIKGGSCIMKGILSLVVLLLIISLIGFATNPSYEDYKEWYKTQNFKDAQATGKIEQAVVGVISDLVADNSVVRDDYKIYSLYVTNTDNYNYKVVGAFNNFFVLENEQETIVAK